jgi:hypothetical protein
VNRQDAKDAKKIKREFGKSSILIKHLINTVLLGALGVLAVKILTAS